MQPLDVVVIWGGPSGEAAVSRRSAEGVLRALLQAGHHARLEELERQVARRLLDNPPDCLFPVTHGPLGEDGCLQGLLEVLGLPYVGCDVRASALGASKPDAKRLWAAVGVPVASERVVLRGQDLAAAAAEARASLGASLVVKPASGGSAIGVVIVTAEQPIEALVEALAAVTALDPQALVEPFLVGHEATCGVLEDAAGVAFALPPTLILPERAGFYDFASKYAPGGSRHRCPAPFAPELITHLQSLAVKAHVALGARDLSRVDFIVNPELAVAESATVLEINTLPGMTATSLYPEAAQAAGWSFPQLVSHLVERAVSRPRRAPPSVIEIPD